MSIVQFKRRLPLTLLCLVPLAALLLGSSLLYSAGPQPEDAADLSESVRVEFATSLRRVSRTGYEVTARLHNTTEAALRGPLVLVVDATGIEQLAVQNESGKLPTGEPYFEFVPAGAELAAEETTAEVKLPFLAAEGRLSVGQRRKFDLDYRVVQLAETAEKPQASRNRGNGGFASAPGSRNSGNSAGSSNNGKSSPNSSEQPARPQDDPAPTDKPVGQQPPLDDIDESDIVTADEPRIRRPIPSDREVARTVKIQDRWNRRLLNREGVRGVGTGMNSRGEAVVVVYIERAGIRKLLPETVEGVAVQSRVISKFRPLAPPPQDKVVHLGNPPDQTVPADCLDDPTNQFPPAIPIGVSVGNVTSGGSGTIGCRLRDRNGNQFLLSNNHVLALNNAATIGDAIQHPGVGDAGSNDPSFQIGFLADFEPVVYATLPLTVNSPTNIMDAAICQLTSNDLVGTTGPCYGYGTPRQTPCNAVLGLKVQKVGRTTQRTRGFISTLNAALSLAGPTATEVSVFVDQIVCETHDGTNFGAEGDSGSVVVTNPGNSPVALLFAGPQGGGPASCNLIGPVLERFDMTIDGIDDSGR